MLSGPSPGFLSCGAGWHDGWRQTKWMIIQGPKKVAPVRLEVEPDGVTVPFPDDITACYELRELMPSTDSYKG